MLALHLPVEGLRDLGRQLEDLAALGESLRSFGFSTAEVEWKAHQLRSAPLLVPCAMCRRREVAIACYLDWRGQPPVCEPCAHAACDRMGCYVPAEVVIEHGRVVKVLCGRHGMAMVATLTGPVAIRHIPDGPGRRRYASAVRSQARRRQRLAAA